MKLETKAVYNVIGTINGKDEPGKTTVTNLWSHFPNFNFNFPWLPLLTDRLVLLGNHRDAWVFGAADPSSGTAALKEIAKKLGEIKEKGKGRFRLQREWEEDKALLHGVFTRGKWLWDPLNTRNSDTRIRIVHCLSKCFRRWNNEFQNASEMMFPWLHDSLHEAVRLQDDQ